MQIIFVKDTRSPRVAELQDLFEETKNLLWKKCKPNQFIRHQRPSTEELHGEYLYCVETDDLTRFLKTRPLNADVFYISSRNIDALQKTLPYFNQLIKSDNNSYIVFFAFGMLMRFNIQEHKDLIDIISKAFTDDVNWIPIIYYLLIGFDFENKQNEIMHNSINDILDHLIKSPTFYSIFVLTLIYAEDQPRLFLQCLESEMLIRALQQDPCKKVWDQCLVFVEQYGSMGYLRRAHENTVHALTRDETSRTVDDVEPNSIVIRRPDPAGIDLDWWCTILIIDFEQALWIDVDRFSKMRLLKIQTNTAIYEEKMELKKEWIHRLYAIAPHLTLLDLSENKFSLEILAIPRPESLQRVKINDFVRIRFENDITIQSNLKMQPPPTSVELLSNDLLFIMSQESVHLEQLKYWFALNKGQLFNELIESPAFISFFFEIDACGDSIFRCWANHPIGLEFLNRALKNIKFVLVFFQHPGFWEAFHHVHTEMNISTSVLYGLCHEPELNILKRILAFMKPDFIGDVNKLFSFTAAITESNHRGDSGFESTAIHALKTRKEPRHQAVINTFKSLFVPPFFNQEDFWKDSEQSDEVAAEITLPAEKSAKGKAVSSERSLLSGKTVFRKSQQKATCNQLQGELEAKSSSLLKKVILDPHFLNVLFENHAESRKKERLITYGESVFYYWVKWDFMQNTLTWIADNHISHEGFIQHPLLMQALLSVMADDNRSALHYLVQKKWLAILRHIETPLMAYIQKNPEAFLALLFHSTGDKDNISGCLMMDLCQHHEALTSFIGAIFQEENQKRLIKALSGVSIDFGQVGWVNPLEQLKAYYPNSPFLNLLVQRNKESVFNQFKQDKASLIALLDASKENRKCLAQAFELDSFQQAWNQLTLQDHHVQLIISVIYEKLFQRIQAKGESAYLPVLLERLLRHPSSLIQKYLMDKKYSALKNWLEKQSLTHAGVVEHATDRRPEAAEPQSMVLLSQPLELKKAPLFEQNKRPKSIAIMPLEAKLATEASPSPLMDEGLKARESVHFIFELMNQINQKTFCELEPTRVLFTMNALMSSNQEALIYQSFEAICRDNPSMNSMMNTRQAFDEAKILLFIQLLFYIMPDRMGVDSTMLEKLKACPRPSIASVINQLLTSKQAFSPWLIQVSLLMIDRYYRFASGAMNKHVKHLLIQYLVLSQDAEFLRGLLGVALIKNRFKDSDSKVLTAVKSLLDSASDDLQQLKVYYVHLEFGVTFDLLIYPKLLSLMSFFNEEKTNDMFKIRHRVKQFIQELFKDRLVSKYDGLERWLQAIFKTEPIILLCGQSDLKFVEWLKEYARVLELNEEQVRKKIQAYEAVQALAIKETTLSTAPKFVDAGSALMVFDSPFEEEKEVVGVDKVPAAAVHYFQHRPNIYALLCSMMSFSSGFQPCIVGSQARNAAQQMGLFDSEHDLDFDIFCCERPVTELSLLESLERNAYDWLHSAIPSVFFSERPKCLKKGYSVEPGIAWCSFKAKSGTTEIDMRFVFSSYSKERAIAWSRRERCLTYSSYLWDLAEQVVYIPRPVNQMTLMKPLSELTINNMAYAFWLAASHPEYMKTPYFERLLKAALSQYLQNPSFNDLINSALTMQFRRKLGSNPEVKIRKLMAELSHHYFPSVKPDTFFNAVLMRYSPHLSISPDSGIDALSDGASADSGRWTPSRQ